MCGWTAHDTTTQQDGQRSNIHMSTSCRRLCLMLQAQQCGASTHGASRATPMDRLKAKPEHVVLITGARRAWHMQTCPPRPQWH
jgi:hypothetical protein